MQKLQKLWKYLCYQNPYAKLIFTALGAPWLILALFILPSPMTAMKIQIYWIIIPIGVGGTIISALVEARYRRCLHRRRMSVVVWLRRPPH